MATETSGPLIIGIGLAVMGALGRGQADEDCDGDGGCGPFVCSYCEPYLGQLVKRGCSRLGEVFVAS